MRPPTPTPRSRADPNLIADPFTGAHFSEQCAALSHQSSLCRLTFRLCPRRVAEYDKSIPGDQIINHWAGPVDDIHSHASDSPTSLRLPYIQITLGGDCITRSLAEKAWHGILHGLQLSVIGLVVASDRAVVHREPEASCRSGSLSDGDSQRTRYGIPPERSRPTRPLWQCSGLPTTAESI